MDVRRIIEQERLIGIIRVDSAEHAVLAAEAALAAGVSLIEFTWNTPGALGLIERFAAEDTVVGVGTITDPDDAESAIASGARFVVTPVATRVVVDACRGRGVVCVCGASTPTEIWNAYRWGADLVKVFPVATLGGAEYLRLVRGPLGHVPLVATGGVTLENMAALLAAGATAVGVTSGLFAPDLLARGDREGLEERARALLAERPK